MHDHSFGQAAALAGWLLVSEPNNVDALLVLGDARLELGQYDLATDAYQRAIDLRTELATIERVAHLRWLLGDAEGALELHTAAIRHAGPTQTEAIAWCETQLGEIHLRQGRPVLSLAAARSAAARVTHYGPAQSLSARALVALGRPSEAVELLERDLQRGDRHGADSDLLLLVDLYGGAEASLGARQLLSRVEGHADHDPRHLALYLARHDIQAERALALAERAAGERMTIETLDALSLALARSGRLEEAAAMSARARSVGTVDARLMLHEALIRALAGETRRAGELLAEARSVEPMVDPLLVAEVAGLLGEI